jgi:hypothetical protein
MPQPRRLRGRRERGGFTILMVLALISMTLGVSYSLLRTQAASARSSNNSETRIGARQAALSGLSAGIRRISQTSWGGVGSTISGNLTGSDSYSVTFTTGDATLPATGTTANDYPYRVTLVSTGYSVDPSSSSVTTTYKVEAVLRLSPQGLAANPSPWSTFLPYTFYQTSTDNLSIELPLRITGSQRWQGGLASFMAEYPNSGTMSNRYLSDLNAMRSNGYADFRPFSGPIVLPTANTTSTIRSQLTNSLAITLTNASAVTINNWAHPGSVSTYRLYAGGPTYTIPTLGSSISGTTLQPEPHTNPAGLYYRSGDLTLGNGASVIGTLIVTGNTIFSGTNVSVISNTQLLPLSGTTTPPQLPAIISGDDVRVNPGASAVVRGVVATFDDFTSLAGTQNTTFDLQGNLIARNVIVEKRTEWDQGNGYWISTFVAFTGQLTIPYWPVYLNGQGLNYTPRLTIAPPTTTGVRQWFNGSAPVYAVGSGDAGLQWSVLRVTELR